MFGPLVFPATNIIASNPPRLILRQQLRRRFSPGKTRPPNEAASHGALRNRLLLDLDDEAGRGLLRLVALSIEGLPGGRLEERYSIVDAVLFDDADIGRRRCTLDGDDTAAQREKRLAVVVGNGLADGRQVLRHRGIVSYDILADAVGLELGLGVQALCGRCTDRDTDNYGDHDFRLCMHDTFPLRSRIQTVRPLAGARAILRLANAIDGRPKKPVSKRAPADGTIAARSAERKSALPVSPAAQKHVCPVRRVIRRSLTRKPKARLSQRQRALCDPHYGVRQHSAVTLSPPHWRIGFILFYSFTPTLSYRAFGNPCEGAMHFRTGTDSRANAAWTMIQRSNRFSWSRRLSGVARPFWRCPGKIDHG